MNKTAELKKAEKMMDIMYTDAEYYLEYRLGMHTFEEFVDFAKIGNHNSMWIDFLENNIDRSEYDLEGLMKEHHLEDFGNMADAGFGNNPICYGLLNNSFHSLVDCDALMEIVWSPEESCPTDLEQSHWKSVEKDIEDIMLYAREKDADLRQSVMKTLKVLMNDIGEKNADIGFNEGMSEYFEEKRKEKAIMLAGINPDDWHNSSTTDEVYND